MTFEFKFPDVGEGIHEGEIVRWRVKVGDEIKEDQPLMEVETAKAIVELPSPKTGTVLAIQGKEGEVIHVGDLLVVIGEKGEKWVAGEGDAQRKILKQVQDDNNKAPGVVGQIPTEMKGFSLPSRLSQTEGDAGKMPQILPRIRKLAAELGVDITKIKGSGPGGQIMEEDIRGQRTERKQIDYETYGVIEKVPLKGIRKAISQHMTQSMQTIPHVTHMDEFDATRLVEARLKAKPEAEKQGIKLTYLAYIVKAVTDALKKHPECNSTLQEANSEIIYKKYYNIGIAVDTPDGLLVPVLKNADQKDVFQIAAKIVALAEKCKNRTVTPTDLEGASFTITNIGSIGGIYATPIIPVGQAAILGVMEMKEKPAAIEGKLEIRPMMTLALSFDHRLVDGAQAARFMNDVIAALS